MHVLYMHGIEALFRIDFIFLAEWKPRLCSLLCLGFFLPVCFALALSPREVLLHAHLLHMAQWSRPHLAPDLLLTLDFCGSEFEFSAGTSFTQVFIICPISFS